jgi:hypothetical protein
MWVWNQNQVVESSIGFGAKGVTIEHSTDGDNWATLGDFEFVGGSGLDDYAANTMVDFAGAAARYVRLTIHSNWGGIVPQYGLSEVRFFHIPVTAREPNPASEAVGVAPDTALSWRSGRGAAEHEVYLSHSKAALANGTALVGTVTDSQFEPSDLRLGTTYYWKVNEVNTASDPSVWEGDVWTFATQEFLPVDDFESYDDKENRIYEVWIDREVNKTGSQVGYMEAAAGTFGERTIVHGGRQSMPILYDNSHTPWYSEAKRTFSASQDWTLYGADALVLHFRGSPAAFLQRADGSMVMGSEGTGIGGTADQFRFAYKQLAGNGSIVARVDSLADVNAWAKAGVMIRHSLEPGSKLAFVYLTPANGCRFQIRDTYSTNATDDTVVATAEQTAIRAPYWVKLERSNDTFNGFYSSDGKTWTAMAWNPQTIAIQGPIHIGLAVTSHSVASATTAVWSGVTTSGDVSGPWQMADIGIEQLSSDPASLYVMLQDSAGRSAVVSRPDSEATVAGVWRPWRIALSEFSAAGVDVTRVTAMAVGVGDRNNATPGGTGLLYIDDIRLAPPLPAKTVTVLVSDTSGRVLQYQVAGSTWTYEKVFAGGVYDGVPLTLPMGICQDHQGRIYVGEQTNQGRVLRFDREGNYLDTVATDGQGGFVARCEAVVLGPDGHVYVVDAFRGTGDQVYRIDVETKAVSIFVPNVFDGVRRLENPRGVSFGPNGNCFVSGRQNHAVLEFDGTTGVYVGAFAERPHIDTPQDLLWVEDKLLVVYSGRGGGIAQFNADGSFDRQVLNEGLGGPPTLITLGVVNDRIYAVGYAGHGVYRVENPTTITRVTPESGEGALLNPNRLFVLSEESY